MLFYFRSIARTWHEGGYYFLLTHLPPLDEVQRDWTFLSSTYLAAHARDKKPRYISTFSPLSSVPQEPSFMVQEQGRRSITPPPPPFCFLGGNRTQLLKMLLSQLLLYASVPSNSSL
ncbi:hypothetical protein VTK26DRAFT_9302 [Humicola hyalothermophila]